MRLPAGVLAGDVLVAAVDARVSKAQIKPPSGWELIRSDSNPAGATLTPELEARARELMRLKIAGDRNSGSVQPQANPEAQAKAVAILNQSEAELRAGIRPDTAEQTRILRLKIAESRGTITPAEAAQAVAGPATQSAGVDGQLAAVPTRATPAIGASPVTFQTSNKTGLARLNELTELYKADKITPSEYHHERAKIVATL